MSEFLPQPSPQVHHNVAFQVGSQHRGPSLLQHLDDPVCRMAEVIGTDGDHGQLSPDLLQPGRIRGGPTLMGHFEDIGVQATIDELRLSISQCRFTTTSLMPDEPIRPPDIGHIGGRASA